MSSSCLPTEVFIRLLNKSADVESIWSQLVSVSSFDLLALYDGEDLLVWLSFPSVGRSLDIIEFSISIGRSVLGGFSLCVRNL